VGGDHGRPQKFFQGEATSTYCLSFSSCWRYNANGRSYCAVSFLHQKGNYPWHGNSHKKCALLAVIVNCITIIYTRAHNLFTISGRITFIFLNYGRHKCFHKSVWFLKKLNSVVDYRFCISHWMLPRHWWKFYWRWSWSASCKGSKLEKFVYTVL